MRIGEEDRDILNAALAALSKEHERIKDAICAGNPQTFDEYRMQVGICAGLEMAADTIREVAENWGKEKDEDDHRD